MSGFDVLERLQPQVNTEQVVISRAWNHPQITVTVNKERITVISGIDDFVSGLIAELKIPEEKTPELGKIAKLLLGDLQVTRPKVNLESAIRDAANRALEKIKEATSQVM